MRYAALLHGCAILGLAACTDTYHVNTQVGATPALLTTADLRIITDRPVPNAAGDPSRRAVCTEPSPDVAKALSTALSLTAKANVPSGASGEGSLNNQTAEQAMELAGRVPGVIALRDGTYRLCEAWANGAIGNSAYALALGRYGELLVTLMLGEDMIASLRLPPGKLTGELPADTGGGQAGDGTGTPAKSATQSGGDKSKLGQTGFGASAVPVQLASLNAGSLFAAVSDPLSTTTSNAGTTPAGKATTPAASKQGDTGGNTPASGSIAAAAQAFEQMQYNYLTLGPAGPLIAACVAAGDHTTAGWQPNDVLTPALCMGVVESYGEALKTAAKNRMSANTTKPTAAILTSRH